MDTGRRARTGAREDGWFRVQVGVVRIRTRNLNYSEIARVLLKVGNAFVPVNRKTAYYARQRLEQVTGRRVVSWRSEFEGQTGYLFTLVDEDESRSTPANTEAAPSHRSSSAGAEPAEDTSLS